VLAERSVVYQYSTALQCTVSAPVRCDGGTLQVLSQLLAVLRALQSV